MQVALEKLRPMAQQACGGSTASPLDDASKLQRNNTIILMICYHGQSELVINFVCSARARGY
jgi:hypothetical protein